MKILRGFLYAQNYGDKNLIVTPPLSIGGILVSCTVMCGFFYCLQQGGVGYGHKICTAYSWSVTFEFELNNKLIQIWRLRHE